MKKKILIQIYFLIIVLLVMNQIVKAQCQCTLPNYGCPIGNQSCVMGCAYYCSHPACYGTATITASDSLTFFTGDSVVLTAHRTAASAYQWINDTVNITGATSQDYVAYTSGIYKCKVTTSCNTKVSPALTVTVTTLPTGITQYGIKNGLTIYPNPFSNSTTISFKLSKSEKISVKVFDVNGRLVTTLANKIFETGKNELEWNADEVNAGVYFLQMQTEKNLQTEKLIVTK